jgi:hypothetical protein
MESIEAFLEKFPELTTEERLEVINHQWLFANAPERSRARALERLKSLRERAGVDARTVMKTIREVGRDLQKAIEERIAASILIEST